MDLFIVTYQIPSMILPYEIKYQTRQNVEATREYVNKEGGWIVVSAQTSTDEESNHMDLLCLVRCFLRDLDGGEIKIDFPTAYVDGLRQHLGDLIKFLPLQARAPALVRSVKHFLDGLDRDMFALSGETYYVTMMRNAVAPVLAEAA